MVVLTLFGFRLTYMTTQRLTSSRITDLTKTQVIAQYAVVEYLLFV